MLQARLRAPGQLACLRVSWRASGTVIRLRSNRRPPNRPSKCITAAVDQSSAVSSACRCLLILRNCPSAVCRRLPRLPGCVKRVWAAMLRGAGCCPCTDPEFAPGGFGALCPNRSTLVNTGQYWSEPVQAGASPEPAERARSPCPNSPAALRPVPAASARPGFPCSLRLLSVA